jgi:hypothetical protein
VTVVRVTADTVNAAGTAIGFHGKRAAGPRLQIADVDGGWTVAGASWSAGRTWYDHDTPTCLPVRADGRTAGILRDLWLGGVPLPRAAAAAGLTVKAAEQTLRSLGLAPAVPGPNTRDRSGRAQSAPKRKRRRWSALRPEVVRLDAEGRSIRAVATELGMHHREVWRQLQLAGVTRRVLTRVDQIG